MTPSIGTRLKRRYFEIHILEFTIAFDLYIFLADRNPLLLLLGFGDRSLQIEQQAFSSHLQNVEAGSAGRKRKITTHVSTGFKDFHIVVNHHSGGSIFRQQDAIGLFM